LLLFLIVLPRLPRAGRSSQNNRFFQAAIHGDNKTLTWLLEMARDDNRPPSEVIKRVNEVDEEGDFPLFLAAVHGNAEVALTLLDNGADVTLKAREDLSPLMAAAAGTARPSNQTHIVDMRALAICGSIAAHLPAAATPDSHAARAD